MPVAVVDGASDDAYHLIFTVWIVRPGELADDKLHRAAVQSEDLTVTKCTCAVVLTQDRLDDTRVEA